jgi:MFS transporter, SHS family, lactate transporter
MTTEQHMGFALPMLMGKLAGSASVIVALLISPETKGTVFVAELINRREPEVFLT